MRISALLLFAWASVFAGPAAAGTDPGSSPLSRLFGGPSARQALQTSLDRLDSGRALKAAGAIVTRDQDLASFYRGRQAAPAWFVNGHPARAAWQLLDAVQKCSWEGLDP